MRRRSSLALVVAGFVATTLGACRSVPVGDQVAIYGGHQLHFSTLGDLDDLEEGESILIVPSASFLAADVLELADGRPVVFYDGRGRGSSDPVDDPALLGLERDLADLEMLRRHLGLESFSLLAWSYDAAVAAAYARRAPNRIEHLILVCPPPLAPAESHSRAPRIRERAEALGLPGAAELASDPRRTTDPEAFAASYLRATWEPTLADPESLGEMRSNPYVSPNADPIPVARRMEHASDTVFAFDWDLLLPGLGVPTLLIHGAEDATPLGSSLGWKALCPDIEVVVLDGAGALPWLEAPGPFFSVVERFLTGEAALPTHP